ncbi:hypothetical protein BGX24_010415 [Mortierella sp. AD032]|nr:hypothetical protein BGX24_010415 [Mortierella sp. AD032]
MATLHSSSSNDFAVAATTETLLDPLTDASFFNTARRHSAPSSSGFVLESPTLDSTPYEFEMQRFNAYDGSSPSTVKVITTLVPKHSSATSTTTTGAATTRLDQTKPANSFFTGWMAVPPSLAGRPKLSQDQEDYIRREYERGPVPLMWAKNDDIENQASTPVAAPVAVAPMSKSWFGNWGFRSSTTTTATASTAAAATSVAAPPRAAFGSISSDSGRRDASQAL